MAITRKGIPEGSIQKPKQCHQQRQQKQTETKYSSEPKARKFAYPNMTGIQKLTPSKRYLRKTIKPIERDIYEVFNINTETAFMRGFRFDSTEKTDVDTVVKACEDKEKVKKAIEETGVNTRKFIKHLWDILERPNFETVYRTFGLEGLKCLNIYIEPKVLVITTKRMKKYYKHRPLQNESMEVANSNS